MGKNLDNKTKKEVKAEKPNKAGKSGSELGERLKALRKDNIYNIDLIREACRHSKKCKGWCNKYNNDEIICEKCNPSRDHGFYDKLTQECLAWGVKTSINTIERCEQEGKMSSKTERAYRNFFGDDLFNKYILEFNSSNANDVFLKKGTSSSPYFLHRTDEQGAEFKSLFDRITKNKVTIVCADGGVGKTTLVEQFLYEYENNENNENFTYENYVKYYQTIDFNTAMQGEGFDLIKSFLSAIELTESGDKEFFNYCGVVDIKNPTKEDRRNWVGKMLNEFTGLFVLDNLICVTGDKISKLETEFPKCKFIITTRTIDEGLKANADIVLTLESFKDGQEQKLFELYLGRKDNPLNEDEKKIFDEQINSWCLGNAEAIYYVAKMLSYSFLKLSDYCQIEKQGLEFTTGLKNDANKSSLADKLLVLMRVDEGLRQWLEEKEVKNTGAFNVLSILSLTEMQEIPEQSLIEFLCDNQGLQAKVDFKDEINKLERKGLIKFNSSNKCVKMHPLICETLKLNGIETKYTDSIKFFVALITDNESLTYNLVDKIKVLNRKTLKIPKGIKKIKRFISLYDDFDYGEIDFRNSTVEIVGEHAFERWNFQGKLRLMEQIDEALGLLFYNKYSKKVLINFSDSITEIGKNAFAGNQMEILSLPENLKTIGEKAFYGCCNIERITIPDSVTEMGKWAFADCFLLKEVTLPNQLEIINKFVFKRCCSLKEITIPDNVKKISADAFSGCRSLKGINFGNGVVEIGANAFYENDSLKSIKFPKSLKQIGSTAFCNCYQLKEIDLCNVEKICEGAFWGCKSLTSIKIPSTIKVIEKDAFYGCPLEKITVEEGCLYKEKGGELYNETNEIIFSVSDKPNLKTEDEWFLAQGDLKKALYDDTGKYLPLINNNGESVIFTRIFVCNIEEETYCILFEWDFLKGRGRHVYKLCNKNGKICLKKEWDFNTCVEIFWRYYEITQYTKE